MNENWRTQVERFNALTLRERVILVSSLTLVMVFLWWFYLAEPLLENTRELQRQALGVDRDTGVMRTTLASIERRIAEGVHKTRLEQLEIRRRELDRIDSLLEQKTLELIDPSEMFDLMQRMLFAESRLKLNGLKRKRVSPVFAEREDADEGEPQPNIFRHVMQMNFEGSYRDILNYVQRLEDIERKLLWDRISLKTGEYPVIQVEIEISTLSDDRHWVGL